MAVTLTSRQADGTIVSIPFDPGDASPTAGAAAPAGTDAHGATPPGPASPAVPTDSPPVPPHAPAEPGRPPDGSAADAGVADTDDDEPEPEVATVDYVARRIKRLTAKQRAQERSHAAREQAWTQERAHLQGQLDVMHGLQRLLLGATPPLPETPPGPPQAEQFTSHEDYVRALARFEAQEVARTQQQSQAQQSQAQQLQQALLEREAAFQQAHPDFHDVVRRGLAGKVAPHVQQALMVLPEGPQLAYTLAQQPDTVQRLNTLPPPLVLAELGRLSAAQTTPAGTPEAAETPTPTHGTAAPAAPAPPPLPPPPTPLSGMGQGAPSGATPDMSQAEFRRLWAQGWRPSPRDFGRP